MTFFCYIMIKMHSSPCFNAWDKSSNCEIFYFPFVTQHWFHEYFEGIIRKNKSKFGSFKKHFHHNYS